jgi:hypothetical protein
MNTNRPILLAGLMVIALIAATITQLQKDEPIPPKAAPSSDNDSGMDAAEQERMMRKIGYVM